MKKFIFTTFLLLPLSAFAALPAFPMSFYGTATINGAPAPVGTIIRAYYGATLAGQVNVNEVGIYGYDNPTQQQLLLGEGTGTIRFTVQSSTINSGAETEGSTLQTHTSFVSGDAILKNLTFTWSAPAPTPAPAPSSGGGGGGGGGGGPAVLYGCMDKKAVNYSPIATVDNKACIYPAGVTASTTIPIPVPVVQPTAIKPTGEVLGVATFIFTRNLTVGSSGTDVTELQERLTREGDYSGPITGYFGPLTEAGVKKYQSRKGIVSSGAPGTTGFGYVGPKTRSVLNESGSVLGASTVSTSVTVLTPEARETLIKQLLSMIAELQKQLATLKAKQQ